eukprot:scaffold9498_cov79-Phaeocystis_antarctica.AAC.1
MKPRHRRETRGGGTPSREALACCEAVGRAPLGGGLDPGVCATATGFGRGLDGCEPEGLCLDSHRLEGLGRAPPVELRRTRRVAPHCGWSGSRRGLARPCGPEGLTLARV